MKRSASLALAMAFLAGGCGGISPDTYDRSKVDTTPVDGGTFVAASIGDATYLNPIFSTDSASSDINGLVFNGLVKYDKNLVLIGDLAERFEVSDGGKVITFHLRRNVKWHDGTPFTSADVMFTYETLIASTTRTAFATDYLRVQKAEAPDPYTFRVRYAEVFAPSLESWGMGIIPRHVFAGTDVNTNPANRRPIGTGPYQFKEWLPDEKIVLEAYPDFHAGRPHIDRYVYRIIPDQSVQFLELRQGTLSMLTPTPDQYNGYQQFFNSYVKYRYPAFRYDYVAFNLENPLFKDRRVRRALAMAVNRKEIITGVYQGLAVPSTGPFPPTSWAYNPDVEPYPYDIEAAKNLLAEAGWKDADGDGVLDRNGRRFEFTLVTNQGNKVRESMALVIQNGFARVGVKMNVRIMEWSVFIHKYVDQKQFEAVLLAWNLARDPDCLTIWHSSQRAPGQYNFAGYVNPEVDRLLEAGVRTFDIDERRRIYHKVHRLIAADVPYIFLTTPEALPVIHKKILGPELAPAGIGWNFEDWYIPRAWQNEGYGA